MKVKFTKLAALLLAGVALFATGCTDYEVDIQKVDKKVDNLTTEVNGKISSLEQQIAGINATIANLETVANHDKDIQALRGEMETLKSTLQTEFNGKINQAVADLTTEINKKVNQADYDVDKANITKAIGDLNDALDAAKLRIKALEDADFQGQIDGVKGRVQNLEALLKGDWDGKTVKETIDAVAKSVSDLESEMNGKIGALDLRLTKAEKAIDDLMKEDGIIDQLKKRVEDLEAAKIKMEGDIELLQSGKLDKDIFDQYVEETAVTVSAMKTAIGDLTQLKDVAKDKTSLVDAINAVIAKFGDYVLTSTFKEFVDIAATDAELTELQTYLEGRIQVCEDLLAGDWGGETVQEYIDAQAEELQGQLDLITNEEGTGRLDELEEAAKKYFAQVDKIWDLVKFAEDYEGEYGVGLQGYIDDGDAWALNSAKDYTDDKIELAMQVVMDIYNEIYGVLQDMLDRVQSIAFVPDYDDNKITVDLVYNVDPLTGKWTVLGKKTVITYKVIPAEAAKAVVAKWADDPESFYFDVKPVLTRADGETEDEEEGAPDFEVIDVQMNELNADKGWVDVTVRPINIASEFFAYNQLNADAPVPPVMKPMGYVEAITDEVVVGNDYYDWMDQAFAGGFYFVYETPGMDEFHEQFLDMMDNLQELFDVWWDTPYGSAAEYEAQYALYDAYDDFIEWFYGYLDEYYTSTEDMVGSMMDAYDEYFADLQAYSDASFNKASAKSFAAALVIDSATETESDMEGFDIDVNLSSQFNVLYPSKFEDSDKFTVLNDPYYKDETGKYVKVEEHQKLPYNSDEIKTIFKDAVAVVEYDGELYSYQDLRDLGFYVPELPETEGKVAFIAGEGKNYADNSDKIKAFFELDPETGTLPISEDHDLINSYDVQMNQGRTVSELAEAVGDKASATYKFYTIVGSFLATGDVEVTKPLYTINGTATIDWNYAADKEADHARYYLRQNIYDLQSEPYTDEDKAYSREVVEIVLDATEVADLLETSGVAAEEIAAITEEPELKVEVAAKEGAEELTEEEAAALAAAVKFTNLVFDPETKELTVSATGFEFDYVYTVTAVYKNDLPIELTLAVELTTNDRPRDTMVVNVTPNPKKVMWNGEEYDAENDFYSVQSDDVREAIQALFEDGILTVGADGDYEDTDAFVAGELQFKRAYKDNATLAQLPAEKQTPYLDVKQVYMTTENAAKKVTSEVLTQITGTKLVRTVTTYIGQVIEMTWQLDIDLPLYDFQHNETFVTSGAPIYVEKETESPAPRFAKENGDVYYTDVHPDYDTREVLAHFDVSNVDLLARPFDIVDAEGNKLVVDPDQDIDEIADNNLVVYFTWLEEPEDEGIVWVEEAEKDQHTIDYGGLDPVVRVVGHIEMVAAGNPDVFVTLPTKFDAGKLYDKFEVRQFKPFKPLVAEGITVKTDRHIIVETKIFDGIVFEDVRGKALYEDGDWVLGDGTEANGFAEGVMSYEAYDINWEEALEFTTEGVPEDLRSLIWFDKETQTMFFDYRSEIPLYKDNTFKVTVKITTKWQILEATFDVTIPANAN